MVDGTTEIATPRQELGAEARIKTPQRKRAPHMAELSENRKRSNHAASFLGSDYEHSDNWRVAQRDKRTSSMPVLARNPLRTRRRCGCADCN